MSLTGKIFPLYLVTGRKINKPISDFLTDIEDCLKVGAKLIQLREKGISAKYFLEISKGIASFKSSFKFTFFVNDRPDIAFISGADGVHVGQEDVPPEYVKKFFPKLLVGVSTHSELEFEMAMNKNVDYVALGPIFKTSTKPKSVPVGIGLLKKVRKISQKPIVAIGGINLENFIEVLEAGADSVAVCSDIFNAKTPAKRVEEYVDKLSKNGFLL